MDRIDCVVIGAGVVGLAVARALAMQGRETLVLEAEGHFGTGVSSRNSEVIHAGIYYPKGSLKALTCVRGRRLLYQFCASHGVAHARCGKLIVAAHDGQLAQLDGIAAAAAANGVDDMRKLDGPAVRALEPALRAVAALLSPSTGIIDSHQFMLALLGDTEAHGGMVSFLTRISALECAADGVRISVNDEAAPALVANWVINSAGLDAVAVARGARGFPAEHMPQAYLAKGNYFTLSGRAPFRHLIYPMPEPGGLGTHLTLDLGGQARFGPDVEWIDTIAYDVDPRRGERFYQSIRSYWPALPDGALQPGYSGIRPKISGPTEPAADFRIDGPTTHGVAGLVNLFGIESPGLTAALAIAERVAAMVEEGP